MDRSKIIERIEKAVAEDGRYRIEAYIFIMNALELAISKKPVRDHEDEVKPHVSGEELLSGVREYGQHLFGPTAKMVFEHWGVRDTRDFGNIVFNLINAEVLSKSDTDSPEDFVGIYDFGEVFEKQYDWRIENPL